MTRPSAVTIVTVFALLLAGCASLMVYDYLKKQTGKPIHGVQVATAATDIAIGTKLEAGHVKLATWPKEALTAGYQADVKSVTGRVAVRPMSAGDVVAESKLMPLNGPTTGGIMTYIVPQGHRAVTVAVNEVAGVAGFITPNSRVDVVLTSPLPGADKEENISKIILQNVQVLATGQVTEQKEGKPVIVPTVTLDLVPDDAEKLIVGAKKGSLQLLLRNVIDIAAVQTNGATITKALGRGERPVVVAVRKGTVSKRQVLATVTPPKQTVEVIKGGSKTTREFQID